MSIFDHPRTPSGALIADYPGSVDSARRDEKLRTFNNRLAAITKRLGRTPLLHEQWVHYPGIDQPLKESKQ